MSRSRTDNVAAAGRKRESERDDVNTGQDQGKSLPKAGGGRGGGDSDGIATTTTTADAQKAHGAPQNGYIDRWRVTTMSATRTATEPGIGVGSSILLLPRWHANSHRNNTQTHTAVPRPRHNER